MDFAAVFRRPPFDNAWNLLHPPESRKDYRRVCDSLPFPIISNRYVCSLCFVFAVLGCVEVSLPPHPLSSNLLRRVRLFSVECYPMHSFLPFSFLLLSVSNLTLRLSVAASCICRSFYLYLSVLSLSSCLETFVCGLLLSFCPSFCCVILNLTFANTFLDESLFYLCLF